MHQCDSDSVESKYKALHLYLDRDSSGAPFYEHGLTLIPTRINNNMPSKVCNEITYPPQTQW